MRSDDHRTSRSQPLTLDATSGAADWAALLPVSVVALGTPAQPVERLLSVQSAINKVVNAIAYAVARVHRMRSLTAATTGLPANQLQPIDLRAPISAARQLTSP